MRHLYGRDVASKNDSAVFHQPVALTASGVSEATGPYVYFRHSFGFEDTNGITFWDGGVIELSVDGGESWHDAGNLIDGGVGYTGVLSQYNPLGQIAAFAGDSYGYVSSRLNLSNFGGANFQLRFRIGTDNVGNDYGWYIDDYRIYECVPEALFSDGFESGNLSFWSRVVP